MVLSMREIKDVNILRDLYGTYLILRTWIRYINNAPYRGSIKKLKNKDQRNFRKFFIEVEKVRRGDFQGAGINLPDFDKADADGKAWIKYLEDFGLNQQSRVLDYGCGSLRLGKSMINYLEDKKYVGVDISDHFYSLGIQNYLTPETADKKQARFFVIDSEEFNSELKEEKFDFIYSQWVMMHVCPEELEHYFRNILSKLDDEGQFFFDFIHSIINLKQNALTWGYPSRTVFGIIKKLGFKYERLYGNLYRVTKAK